MATRGGNIVTKVRTVVVLLALVVYTNEESRVDQEQSLVQFHAIIPKVRIITSMKNKLLLKKKKNLDPKLWETSSKLSCMKK